jgi:hypothetical protein
VSDGWIFGGRGSAYFVAVFPCVGELARGWHDTGGCSTFYPCIDGSFYFTSIFYYTGWGPIALDFSIAGLHPAAAATHGPSSRCSADGEAEWEVRSCGGWGGGDG